MRIEKIINNKKQFLDLLLLADEQENMIDKYLKIGDLFALYDDDLKSICVVTAIDDETCELKNIATYKKYQGKGYAKTLIKFVADFYKNNYKIMLVGTGDFPPILSFYESCGFEKSHCIKNFFTDNYDQPMFEAGIRLIDMADVNKTVYMNAEILNLTAEAIELLKNLISIPSISREEKEVADFLEKYIEERGYIASRKGNNLWIIGSGFDTSRPTLLLNSHIDTVKPVSGWTFEPFAPTVENDKLYGLGSNDAGAS